MRAHSFILTAGLAAAVPLAAAAETPERKDARMRQISEVVFQNYPPRALAAGEQGPVYFIVRLDEKAHPTSCWVTHGSGYPRLDEETCNLIVQHAVFKSLLNAKGKAVRSMHEGVVNWRIPGTPQPPINPIELTAQTAPPAQICRRTLMTGSLYRYERVCMTEREWEFARAETRDHWGQWQGKKGITNCRIGGRIC